MTTLGDALPGLEVVTDADGVRFEERDLRRQLGAAYADYARQVGRFVPRPT